MSHHRLLRLSVAAARLGGVSTKTIRAWIRRGILRGVRLPNGHWRIPEGEIARCLGENITSPNLPTRAQTR